MVEITGNLWDQSGIKVITTNGYVKSNGEAVMGRGCAYEAAVKYPHFPKLLGRTIRELGNEVRRFRLKYEDTRSDDYVIYSFPVKHNWYELADIKLIEKSAFQLRNCVDVEAIKTITLPRPGCGNGGLRWSVVKAVLDPIFDDRFKVITFGT